MEAASSDPSLEVDSDCSCESENTEQVSFDVDDQDVPKVGMLFGSLEEARKFYADYARRVGFCMKIRNTNRSKKSKEILNQLLSCNREGKRRSDVPVSEKTNATYAANCPARMYVHFLKMIDSWEISKVVLEHSHPCCPIQAEMFPQYRQISMHVRRTIEINDQAGIPPSKSYRSLVMTAGGHEKLNFIEKDVRNFITREVRNVSEEDDAREIGNYFYRMKEKNPNFFYELVIDEDKSIKNAFWADARSRAAFEYFGDVVSFDTTYNKNRYDLPLASFVGVNHHGHSILLGCALMKNEDTESFKWLFRCWLRCMGDKPPKGIITDQCPSMPSAIQACMPTTIHRWCIWHIMKKIPQKLNGYKGHIAIEQEMSYVVWNSHSIYLFETNWKAFINKYDLVENKWLSDLYEDRFLWVPIYLDEHFWAGMRNTQRSESMHAFFNKFITRKSSLIQLVRQYDNCLRNKEEKEREADAVDFIRNIPCASNSSIEAQFEKSYTHAKFKEVQVQFRGKVNCTIISKDGILGAASYQVLEDVSTKISNRYGVVYNSTTGEINCECLLFESRGILCCHCLTVLASERMEKVDSRYVLERWSKKVKRKHTNIMSSYDEPVLDERTQRYDGALSRCFDACQEGSASKELTAILHRGLDKIFKDFQEHEEKEKEKEKGERKNDHIA